MSADHDDVAIPLAYERTADGIVVTLEDARKHCKALGIYTAAASGTRGDTVPIELSSGHVHYRVRCRAGSEPADPKDASRDSAVASAARVGSSGSSDTTPSDPHAPVWDGDPVQRGNTGSELHPPAQGTPGAKKARDRSDRQQILVNGTPIGFPEQVAAEIRKQVRPIPNRELVGIRLDGQSRQHVHTTNGRFIAPEGADAIVPGDRILATDTHLGRILVVEEVGSVQPHILFGVFADDLA